MTLSLLCNVTQYFRMVDLELSGLACHRVGQQHMASSTVSSYEFYKNCANENLSGYSMLVRPAWYQRELYTVYPRIAISSLFYILEGVRIQLMSRTIVFLIRYLVFFVFKTVKQFLTRNVYLQDLGSTNTAPTEDPQPTHKVGRLVSLDTFRG